jgi:hypothetical protein
LGIHNWSGTGEGIYTRALCQKNEESVEIKQRPTKKSGSTLYRTLRALCQKNEESVEIKQRPTKKSGRTLYRTLSPKRAPFQTGIE